VKWNGKKKLRKNKKKRDEDKRRHDEEDKLCEEMETALRKEEEKRKEEMIVKEEHKKSVKDMTSRSGDEKLSTREGSKNDEMAKNWNDEFQELMEMDDDDFYKFKAIAVLTKDFCSVAEGKKKQKAFEVI